MGGTVEEFLAFLIGCNSLRLNEAERVPRLIDETGEPWDQIISRLGLMQEDALFEALVGFSSLKPLPNQAVVAELLPEWNPTFFEKRRAVRISIDDDRPSYGFALVDPFDDVAMQAFEFLDPTAEIYLISDTRYRSLVQGTAQQAGLEIQSDYSSEASRLKDLASAEPIVRLVDDLISRAVQTKSSDVHIEPIEGSYTIQRRIDGDLRPILTIGSGQGLAVISRLKILSSLDIAERRRPQDGRLVFPVSGRNIDIRISTIPSVDGESVVLRILDQASTQLDFAHLGYPIDQIQSLERFALQQNGLVLMTGPTGSGKTTTLYTMLSSIADGSRKILTIEDPVEYQIPNVVQSQVSPEVGLTFSSALRSFLRHDPDVILVGEIRDHETAQTALQAALTGHLVLSTLHTTDAPSAVTRLRDLGIENYLIAETLRGSINQRLVPVACKSCRGSGCADCGQYGVVGRRVVAEIFSVNEAARDLIAGGASSKALAMNDDTYKPLKDRAQDLVHSASMRADDFDRIFGSTG